MVLLRATQGGFIGALRGPNKPEHDVSVDVTQETWKTCLNELQFSTLP
jgi:hypothetical protein